MAQRSDLIGELTWRGLLYQQTEGASAALDAGSVSGYAGFDPTAESLHVGSLVPIMGLVHLQRAGHTPVALVGGGTALIGDPSGKPSERQLLDAEAVRANSAAIRSQLERFVDFSGANAAVMADNAEWLTGLDLLPFLRDTGKHFTVNYMLAKESVKARIETGISFTEFAYMLLQAHDYLELNRRHGVTFQLGGSDQWGNITAGIELIRRAGGKAAYGLTLPLISSAAGTKFGKTEEGTVWLDAELTSPYQFYQFWINTDDREVGSYLRMFTLLSRPEIEQLEAELKAHPEKREAQRALAAEVTTRVHGAESARIAEEVSSVLFGKGESTKLSLPALDALAREIPFTEVALDPSSRIIELVVAAGLAQSKGAARRLLDQGGIYVNGIRAKLDMHLGSAPPLAGKYVLLRKGAKQYALVGAQKDEIRHDKARS
ncbi:MAG: tyrosine--tRNA ligase [Gemmatimonadota bacterium]|nr:tyrosine--tRNA ligase [Gemmatimonadota bacterium]